MRKQHFLSTKNTLSNETLLQNKMNEATLIEAMNERVKSENPFIKFMR